MDEAAVLSNRIILLLFFLLLVAFSLCCSSWISRIDCSPPPSHIPISASCAENTFQQPVGGDQAPYIRAKPYSIHLRRLAGQSLKGFFTKQNLRSLSAHICANGIITVLTLSLRSVWRSLQTCPEGGRDVFFFFPFRSRWDLYTLSCNYFIVVRSLAKTCLLRSMSGAQILRRNSHPTVKPSQHPLTCLTAPSRAFCLLQPLSFNQTLQCCVMC